MADDRGNSAKDARQDRLKLALRENLKRRKAQARDRSAGDEMPSNLHEGGLDKGPPNDDK